MEKSPWYRCWIFGLDFLVVLSRRDKEWVGFLLVLWCWSPQARLSGLYDARDSSLSVHIVNHR